MVTVSEQYEAYPYPERDPADESKRLIEGSPSHPHEIDHFLFTGQRDWSRPFRVLVAGGGTGDGLIMLAQHLANAGHPHQITYVDLSTASRRVAEARAKARGLTNITFHTGSLLDAPDLGTFDYIDCCGVLHHLPEPAQGFAALRAAVAPDGGLGFMVYAPYGRSGVYPLQQAFGALLEGLAPAERLAKARQLVEQLPEDHPFRLNPHLVDHRQSDAGFYDLLLHSQDRAFDVASLMSVLTSTGWELADFTQPALYDLSRIADVPGHLDRAAAMATAEKLRGTIKLHVGYAAPAGRGVRVASGSNRSAVPHLRGVGAKPLAQAIAQRKRPKLTVSGVETRLDLPKQAAPLIAGIDGRNSVAQILNAARLDPMQASTLWSQVDGALRPWGLLVYSGF
ncbi:class I SAM-dependent methyltransferase [Primorskyibacter flagellatus]|uniref:Methyltransferase domain-containing protein n=1 Tax=Primorskyibacter flagellatus TaxID=1387277 RepID=A0A1W2CNB6_9RHOB|nr:class I SAM-dependent methyltransferase [Primorskyibacter flagellatus]SMC86108.1 Methyltransferase domain-containing protein [Primorskyibacter flagellatus]